MNTRFFMVTIVNDDENNQIEAHQIQDNIDRYDEHEGSISVKEINNHDFTDVEDYKKRANESEWHWMQRRPGA